MRCLEGSLFRYVGQTVTVFTVSGGVSGGGFTGVLAHVGDGCIRLITALGAAPACAVGSECGWYGGCHERHRHCGCEHKMKKEKCECREHGMMPYGSGFAGGYNHGRNMFGSVTEIPVDKIASFTHHAI